MRLKAGIGSATLSHVELSSHSTDQDLGELYQGVWGDTFEGHSGVTGDVEAEVCDAEGSQGEEWDLSSDSLKYLDELWNTDDELSCAEADELDGSLQLWTDPEDNGQSENLWEPVQERDPTTPALFNDSRVSDHDFEIAFMSVVDPV